MLCRMDWWAKGFREFYEDAQEDTDLSYPIGYQPGRVHINYEQDHLERLAQLF
jgi:hypothetical protein